MTDNREQILKRDFSADFIEKMKNDNIRVEWVDSLCGFAPFADYNDDECVYCRAEESLVVGNIHNSPVLLEGGVE